MKYVVIGGAGGMGKITVRDLVEFSTPEDTIVIADYDFEKAKALADSYKNQQVIPLRVDVNDLSATAQALRGTSVVVNSVQYHLNLKVMEATLAAGANYTDLGGLFHMTRKQLLLHERFKSAGRLAIIGMGAAPGITNILSRHGCDQLDSVREIHTMVAGSDQTKYKDVPALSVSYSLQTILEEFSIEPAVFTKGEFTFAKPMSGAVAQKFPPPVGIRYPMYTIHSEVATLPLSFKEKGVREVSFKIAFDSEFLDRVKFLRDIGLASHEPVEISGIKVKPIELINKLAMAQTPAKKVGKLKQHEIVRAVVKGMKDKKKRTIILDCHTKGFEKWGVGTDLNTGSPPAVVARMIAEGQIKGSGVLAPENSVPPKPFFELLKKRKMWVEIQQKSGWI
ncbi:MAG: Saccharopine dehydrogenase [Bacteriovoracaceae bacterium]|nr:Saccharopine dehydrogenase [Bacteriovoracaceae bacterium]